MKFEVNGQSLIENPTDKQIQTALESLDTEEETSFAILEKKNMTYMQVWGDAKNGFGIEYQDGSLEEHYNTVDDDFPLKQTVQAFLDYRDGRAEWKDAYTFEKTDMQI